MLTKLVDNKLTTFATSFDSWQQAIWASYEPLLEKSIVSKEYVESVVESVVEYGPYIVVAPFIAMPHSSKNLKNLNQSAIAFMKVEKSVVFDKNDREKDVKLFFSLVACDEKQHIKNIMDLSSMLMNEKLVEELLQAKSDNDLLEIGKRYQL